MPDKHLGAFVRERTGRDIVLWPGYCPTHVCITQKRLLDVKSTHPNAFVMAHPECPAATCREADALLSTGQMLQCAEQSDKKEFIVATEPGIIHALQKRCPDKEFISACDTVCSNMKKLTLEKLLWSLEAEEFEVRVDSELAAKARLSLERMLQVLP